MALYDLRLSLIHISAKLNPAAYNPRKDLKPGDKEYEKLKRSIAAVSYTHLMYTDFTMKQ